MRLEELVIYQTANELSNTIWTLVSTWDNFTKETIGKQLIISTDLIAVHIATGFGRYSQTEAKNYGYNARGCVFETKTLLSKASERNLVSEEDYSMLVEQLENYEIKLNNYIKSIGRNNTQKKPYNPSYNKENSVDGNSFTTTFDEV